jgi:hypothetical protein
MVVVAMGLLYRLCRGDVCRIAMRVEDTPSSCIDFYHWTRDHPRSQRRTVQDRNVLDRR